MLAHDWRDTSLRGLAKHWLPVSVICQLASRDFGRTVTAAELALSGPMQETRLYQQFLLGRYGLLDATIKHPAEYIEALAKLPESIHTALIEWTGRLPKSVKPMPEAAVNRWCRNGLGVTVAPQNIRGAMIVSGHLPLDAGWRQWSFFVARPA
jgi:hypothetical protein